MHIPARVAVTRYGTVVPGGTPLGFSRPVVQIVVSSDPDGNVVNSQLQSIVIVRSAMTMSYDPRFERDGEVCDNPALTGNNLYGNG